VFGVTRTRIFTGHNLSISHETQFLHLSPQGGPAHAEQGGGSITLASGFGEGIDDPAGK